MLGCPGPPGDSTGESTHAASAGHTNPTGEMCAAPSPEIGPPVTVYLRNDSDVDVFVTGSVLNCQGPPFEVRAADDGFLTIELTGCPASCDDLLVNGVCACEAGCNTSLIRIVPGGVYEGTWTGATVMTLFAEEGCYPAECSKVCNYEAQAPAGDYRFYTEYSKAMECGAPDCTCEPSAAGWCEIPDANIGVNEQSPEVEIAYPGAAEVTLSLE